MGHRTISSTAGLVTAEEPGLYHITAEDLRRQRARLKSSWKACRRCPNPAQISLTLLPRGIWSQTNCHASRWPSRGITLIWGETQGRVSAGDSDRMRQIDPIVGSKTSCQLCGSCQRFCSLGPVRECVCLVYLTDCVSSKLTLTPCPNYTRHDRIPGKRRLAVHTTCDATESIKYHSQSEECVGGASLEAHCSRNKMSMFII